MQRVVSLFPYFAMHELIHILMSCFSEAFPILYPNFVMCNQTKINSRLHITKLIWGKSRERSEICEIISPRGLV